MLSQEQISKLRRLMEAREKRDELKQAATAAENEYRDIEADVFEQLDNGPVRRLNNVDLGPPWGKVSFGARETHFGRVIKGKEDEAIAYFTVQGQADAMTEPKLVPKRLNEEVRQRIEDNEELPPGIDFYTRRGVTITRQKD
jgi:hypothetical protein